MLCEFKYNCLLHQQWGYVHFWKFNMASVHHLSFYFPMLSLFSLSGNAIIYCRTEFHWYSLINKGLIGILQILKKSSVRDLVPFPYFCYFSHFGKNWASFSSTKRKCWAKNAKTRLKTELDMLMEIRTKNIARPNFDLSTFTKTKKAAKTELKLNLEAISWEFQR